MAVERYLIVETKLPSSILDELKVKTGEKTVRDALSKAIYHYLECFTPKIEIRDELELLINER